MNTAFGKNIFVNHAYDYDGNGFGYGCTNNSDYRKNFSRRDEREADSIFVKGDGRGTVWFSEELLISMLFSGNGSSNSARNENIKEFLRQV